MDRRIFLGNSLGAVSFLAWGCGREQQGSLRATSSEAMDIQAVAGGIIGGVLPKEFIISKTPVTLAIYEGSHNHDFKVGVEHYNALLRGEVVRVESEVSSGHTHTVTLDPEMQPTYSVADVIPYDARYGEGVFTGETIPREIIMSPATTEFVFDEGSHQHNFTLSIKDLCGLRAGVVLRMDTEETSGHVHPLILDPDYRP